MKRKKDIYLVTGGAGFIGSHVVEELLKQGHSVRAFDNLSTGRRGNLDGFNGDLKFIKGDLRKESDLQKAMRGVRYVFHLAAVGAVARSVANPLNTHESNATGTLKLLMVAKDAGVKRVVFSSSSSIYGNATRFPLREDEKPGPLSPYAASKVMGEHYTRIFCHLYKMETVCLRYFNVFGPRQSPKSKYSAAIPIFIDRLLKGQPPIINGDGRQSRDFTYVKNVVKGNLLAMKKPGAVGGTFNIACQTEYSVLDIVNALKKILGLPKAKITFGPSRAGDIRRSFANNQKAKKILGFKVQTRFYEGLEKTAKWFTKNQTAA